MVRSTHSSIYGQCSRMFVPISSPKPRFSVAKNRSRNLLVSCFIGGGEALVAELSLVNRRSIISRIGRGLPAGILGIL
jgi:hypothetical protein